jgi:hypothetical protein
MIPTRDEMHKIAYDLALSSLVNAFPGKKEDHLRPAALSIALKVAGTLDNIMSDVPRTNRS